MERSIPRFQECFVALVLAVIQALFTRTFVVRAYCVPSPSMEPVLLAGGHILVNKFNHGYRVDSSFPPQLLPMQRVRRGDVVVFASPPDPRRDFFKRSVLIYWSTAGWVLGKARLGIGCTLPAAATPGGFWVFSGSDS